MLYVLAAAVAFAAVLGAWYLSARFFKEEAAPKKSGYLTAVQLTVPGEEAPVAALLVVQDPQGGDPGVYLVPPDVLLEGPNGEYVFAADAMAQGGLRRTSAESSTRPSTPCSPWPSRRWPPGPAAENCRWSSSNPSPWTRPVTRA